MKNLFVLFGVLGNVYLASVNAAAYWDPYCMKETWTLVSQTENFSGSCSLYQKLELREGQHSYPLMKNNPQTVKYWLGGYRHKVVQNNRYLREVWDTCYPQLISSSYIDRREVEFRYYNVENDNLSDTISESFRTAPMLPEEAQAELERAKDRCEADEL